MAKAENDIANEVQDLERDVDIATSDVEQQLSRLREDVAGLVSALAAFGEQKAVDYRRKAGELAEDAKTELAGWEGDLEARIRSKPLQSIAIAAGAGFLAALLTRR
ncbi:hypothetical protein [Ciceribacter sp. L1K23]|uniref:glycine zipper domain-containing protein n=1 Tax=Ciceribacter sp. L1K23 TaxID=2820276 RepID=UPI0032C246D7